MKYPNELNKPPAIEDNRDAFEILRVWIAGDNQHFTLRRGVWPDAAAWGIVLADLAKHAATAYAGNDQEAFAQNTRRITQAFLAEME